MAVAGDMMRRTNIRHGRRQPRPLSIIPPLWGLAVAVPIAVVMALVLIGVLSEGAR